MSDQPEVGRRFARVPASAASVRHYVTEALAPLAGQLDVGAAILLANELATNAIRNGGGEAFAIVVAMEPGAVRIAVEEASAAPPHDEAPAGAGRADPDPALVEALADGWGVGHRAEEEEARTWAWIQLKRAPRN